MVEMAVGAGDYYGRRARALFRRQGGFEYFFSFRTWIHDDQGGIFVLNYIDVFADGPYTELSYHAGYSIEAASL